MHYGCVTAIGLGQLGYKEYINGICSMDTKKFNLSMTNQRRVWRQEPDLCTDGKKHTWERFKEDIPITNAKYEGPSRYAIVEGCLVCHKKVYVDMKDVPSPTA